MAHELYPYAFGFYRVFSFEKRIVGSWLYAAGKIYRANKYFACVLQEVGCARRFGLAIPISRNTSALGKCFSLHH